MKRKNDDAIVLALQGRSPQGHTSLYRWMWEHFEEVRSARVGRPDWIAAATEFSKLGYKSRGDSDLTADAVRKTWKRVEGDWGKARHKKPAAIGAAVRPRPEISPPPDDDEFQLVSVKKGVPDGQ